jgi:hypothetical protein
VRPAWLVVLPSDVGLFDVKHLVHSLKRILVRTVANSKNTFQAIDLDSLWLHIVRNHSQSVTQAGRQVVTSSSTLRLQTYRFPEQSTNRPLQQIDATSLREIRILDLEAQSLDLVLMITIVRMHVVVLMLILLRIGCHCTQGTIDIEALQVQDLIQIHLGMRRTNHWCQLIDLSNRLIDLLISTNRPVSHSQPISQSISD